MLKCVCVRILCSTFHKLFDREQELDELIKKQREEGAEKNFKKMRYPCMGCRLKNGDDEDNCDHWKLLKEFGVYTRDDFVFKLLPHGAWSRCQACLAEIKGEYGQLGAEHGQLGAEHGHLGGAGGELGGNTNNAVNEQRSREAAAKPLTCQVCERTMPRTQFRPGKDGKFDLRQPQTCEQCRAEGKLPTAGRKKRRLE